LESGAFALSCLLAFLMVIPAGARKAPDSSQITPNQSKSSFFIPTPNPKFWPLNNLVHGVEPNLGWSRVPDLRWIYTDLKGFKVI
jgi:hypothetical protein